MNNLSTDPIRTLGLKKLYSKNKCYALRGVSFGVESEQIFALLGPNGSGKSTTFNILTGQVPCSAGDAYLKQQKITQKFTFTSDFGICAQKDALWDLLNVREHLEIFACVKGLKVALYWYL